MLGIVAAALGVLAFGATSLMAELGAAPALAAETAPKETPKEQEEHCAGENAVYELYAYAIGLSLSPENRAEVRQHGSVEVSGESDPEHPLRFAFASSEKKLDAAEFLDSGAGKDMGKGSGGGERYAFTSAKATASPGAVYWDASFTAHLAKCNEGRGEQKSYKTSAMELQVVAEPPAPPPPVEPPPSSGGGRSGGTTTWSPPPPMASSASLRVGITAARKLRLRRRRAIAYLVDCTAACSGTASLKAWALGDPRHGGRRSLRHSRRDGRRHARRHGSRHSRRRSTPLRVLDRTSKVSIKAASGGGQRVTDRFTGRALRELHRALKGRGQVKLEVIATVKDAAGTSVSARRTILLSR
jgi:hypothetical protein